MTAPPYQGPTPGGGSKLPSGCPAPSVMIPVNESVWKAATSRKIPGYRDANEPCGLLGKVVMNQTTNQYAFIDEHGQRREFPKAVKPKTGPSASTSRIHGSKHSSSQLGHTDLHPGSTGAPPPTDKPGGTGHYNLSATCGLTTAVPVSSATWSSIPKGKDMGEKDGCVLGSADKASTIERMLQLDKEMASITKCLEKAVQQGPGGAGHAGAGHPGAGHAGAGHSGPKSSLHSPPSKGSPTESMTNQGDGGVSHAQADLDHANAQLGDAAHSLAHGTEESLRVKAELESSFLNQQSRFLHMLAWFGLLVGVIYYIVAFQTLDEDEQVIGLGICVLILIVVCCTWLWNNVNLSMGH